MKIKVEYVEEDNYFEFAWIYGPVWKRWGINDISISKWHASVF